MSCQYSSICRRAAAGGIWTSFPSPLPREVNQAPQGVAQFDSALNGKYQRGSNVSLPPPIHTLVEVGRQDSERDSRSRRGHRPAGGEPTLRLLIHIGRERTLEERIDVVLQVV